MLCGEFRALTKEKLNLSLITLQMFYTQFFAVREISKGLKSFKMVLLCFYDNSKSHQKTIGNIFFIPFINNQKSMMKIIFSRDQSIGINYKYVL